MTTFNQGRNLQLPRRIPGNLVPVFKTPGRMRLPHKIVGQKKRLVAPAFYVGWQEGANHTEGFSLYTLLEEIPGHSQWSTVSGKTLEDAGFMLPTRRTGREHSHTQINNLNLTLESTRTAA
ncbi:hypothetical protein [Candidatus Nitronereus thalassa]|uniref:Transposase n=1 Tax=Candidatus Nitronereus thalassa TaxID=3020898 RepID=A0ABU3KBA5_9BACT|nr:hypothetical protein [Candidatus Nitronereus thalassa]MDT7043588.1 hypothetical protein [Candidatus Nitronereus thalassa]